MSQNLALILDQSPLETREVLSTWSLRKFEESDNGIFDNGFRKDSKTFMTFLHYFNHFIMSNTKLISTTVTKDVETINAMKRARLHANYWLLIMSRLLKEKPMVNFLGRPDKRKETHIDDNKFENSLVSYCIVLNLYLS